MRQTRMSRVLGPKLLAFCEYAKRPRFALTQDATKRVPCLLNLCYKQRSGSSESALFSVLETGKRARTRLSRPLEPVSP
jgi:hypothetical protein